MRYVITLEETQERYTCAESQHLLQGMESLGRRGIPVGCRGGGCGVCRVQVLSGSYTSKPMSREAISAADEANNVVLACRCFPTSDLSLKVLGRLEKRLLSG